MASKRKNKKKNECFDNEFESDENFAFIAGYTSNGFPYGITWEQQEQILLEEKKYEESLAKKDKAKNNDEVKESDLPF